MKCFYSPADDAVGICKSCGRGLSPNYLVELEFGLACKGRCEESLTKLSKIMEASIRWQNPSQEILKRSGRTMGALGLFLLLFGVLFLWVGFMTQSYIDTFTVISGSFFALFGLLFLFRGYFLSRVINKNKLNGQEP